MTAKKVSKKAKKRGPDLSVTVTKGDVRKDVCPEVVASEQEVKAIAALEARIELIEDGFRFVAKTLKNAYGLSAVGQCFDAITKKFGK